MYCDVRWLQELRKLSGWNDCLQASHGAHSQGSVLYFQQFQTVLILNNWETIFGSIFKRILHNHWSLLYISKRKLVCLQVWEKLLREEKSLIKTMTTRYRAGTWVLTISILQTCTLNVVGTCPSPASCVRSTTNAAICCQTAAQCPNQLVPYVIPGKGCVFS